MGRRAAGSVVAGSVRENTVPFGWRADLMRAPAVRQPGSRGPWPRRRGVFPHSVRFRTQLCCTERWAGAGRLAPRPALPTAINQGDPVKSLSLRSALFAALLAISAVAVHAQDIQDR